MDKKVILITGASAGIGLKTALDLVKQGHTVYGGARRIDAMAPIVEAGGVALSLDVTDDASIKAAIDQVIAEQGQIDVLINNAGFGLYGAAEEIPMDAARAMMEVNVFGLARMCQLALPHMRKARAGKIINISSIGGTIHLPLGSWYHGSKFFVEGYSNSLRTEVKNFGIDVVVVAPGAIYTEFFNVMTKQLTKFSGEGPYAKMAKALAEADQKIAGSDPKVISDAISKAIDAKKPRTIYRAGRGSILFYVCRRLLPHRWFDAAILSMAK